MKLKLKRGRSESSADEANEVPSAPVRGRVLRQAEPERIPAAAGSLHRAYVGGYAPPPEFEEELESYRGRSRFRIKDGLPASRTGKIILGCTLFFCLGALAAGAYMAANYLLHDERFVIPSSANIEIEGNQHMTRAQLLSVFGADVERSIFRVPLAERRTDLERLPWVEHATVMRLFPNRLRVIVTERTPVAFARQGTSIGLVDADGVLLDMPEEAAGDPRYSFPVLTGLEEGAPPATRAARMEIYREFIKAISAPGEHLVEKVSEVDVSNPEDVKAVLNENGSDLLVHFGDERFLERFHHFEEHLAEWQQQYPKLASADMRYERQVVLEMQPGVGVPVAAAAPSDPVTTAAPIKPAPQKTAATEPTHSAAHLAAAKPASRTSAANTKMFRALAAARPPNPTGAAQ